MEPTLNGKNFSYDHTCTLCMENHQTLEQIRKELQQLDKESILEILTTECNIYNLFPADAILWFIKYKILGENQQ